MQRLDGHSNTRPLGGTFEQIKTQKNCYLTSVVNFAIRFFKKLCSCFCFTKSLNNNKYFSGNASALPVSLPNKKELLEFLNLSDSKLRRDDPAVQQFFSILESSPDNNIDPHILYRLRTGLERMVKAYGGRASIYDDSDAIIKFKPPTDSSIVQSNCLSQPNDPNYKKISIILESLMSHGLEKEAKAFCKFAHVLTLIQKSKEPNSILGATLKNWRQIAQLQLKPGSNLSKLVK